MRKAGYNDTMTTQFIRQLFVISLLIITGSQLSACGKKGSLYIAPAATEKPQTVERQKNKQQDKIEQDSNAPENTDKTTDNTTPQAN